MLFGNNMCLAEFAAYYYRYYKTDLSETIDAQPEVLADDINTKLHAKTKHNPPTFSSRKDTTDEWQRSHEIEQG